MRLSKEDTRPRKESICLKISGQMGRWIPGEKYHQQLKQAEETLAKPKEEGKV